MNRIEALASWMQDKSNETLNAWKVDIFFAPALTVSEIYKAYMIGKDPYTYDPFTQGEINAALDIALSQSQPLPDMAARLGRIREAALRLQTELAVLLETLGE